MSQHPHPTRDRTVPTFNSPGGGQYCDTTNSAQMYPCFPDAGHPTEIYNASKRPQFNASHPPPSSSPHGFYSMSSNIPSQSGVAATVSPQSDPRAAKRVKTNSPQPAGFSTFAIPTAPTPQSQAADAAAAEAHRLRMAQAAAGGQSLPGFSHPPTELPPRPYDSRASPFTSSKPPGKITGSQMQYLPDIEARLNRLESAVDKYVELRGQKAVENSKLPGSAQQQQRN